MNAVRLIYSLVLLLVFIVPHLAMSQPVHWADELIDVPDDIETFTAGDYDGDGDIDLVCSVDGQGGTDVYGPAYLLEQDMGSWTMHSLHDSGGESVAVDFDHDGDSDIVMAADSILVWYENTGSIQSMIRHELTNTPTGFRAIACSDFDNDGDWDFFAERMVLDGDEQDEFYLFTQNADSWSLTLVDTYPAAILWMQQVNIEVADFDNDDDADVVVSYGYTYDAAGGLVWYKNIDGVTFARRALNESNRRYYSLAVADVNDDLYPEIFTSCMLDYPWPAEQYTSLYVENAAGSFNDYTMVYNTNYNYSGVLTGMNVADGDGDGDLDVFAAYGMNAHAFFLVNVNNRYFFTRLSDTPDGGTANNTADVLDIDADGDEDIVTLGYDSLRVYRNEGPGDPWSAFDTYYYTTDDDFITFGPEGGLFKYFLAAGNPTQQTEDRDFWVTYYHPQLGDQLLRLQSLSLEPESELSTIHPIVQYVPMNSLPGSYTYRVRFGTYPNDIEAEYAMSIHVLETQQGPASGTAVTLWESSGWEQLDSAPSTSGRVATDHQPATFALSAAYPNPFNPTTTISVALPEAADLEVTVVNTLGQQVAELTNGRTAAGTHAFTFDASALSSGIYFVHATVPGQLNAVQKVVLMK